MANSRYVKKIKSRHVFFNKCAGQFKYPVEVCKNCGIFRLSAVLDGVKVCGGEAYKKKLEAERKIKDEEFFKQLELEKAKTKPWWRLW